MSKSVRTIWLKLARIMCTGGEDTQNAKKDKSALSGAVNDIAYFEVGDDLDAEVRLYSLFSSVEKVALWTGTMTTMIYV